MKILVGWTGFNVAKWLYLCGEKNVRYFQDDYNLGNAWGDQQQINTGLRIMFPFLTFQKVAGVYARNF